jgi:phosphatidylglycerol---prolipoprotein diacylglyceryl transferase
VSANAVHLVFDLLAWTTAGLLGFLLGRTGWVHAPAGARSIASDPGYFTVLALSALAGAILIGSANLGLAGRLMPGHSIAGALVGGVIGVEALKWRRGIRASTGLPFVAPLAAGVAVGRLGCFFAGLPDYSYGTPTQLPWGVDFGDGISRHPVQLYESAAMLLFLVTFLLAVRRRVPFVLQHGFYLFAGWYGVQRFAWEFLKPYPKLLGPFNLFHFVCVALVLYSLLMIRRTRDLHPAV